MTWVNKQLNRLVRKIDTWQQRHHLPAFTVAVLKKYGEDKAGQQAALLTYYGFLALFPLLLILTTLTERLIGNNPELEQTIIGGLTDYFPLIGNQLATNVDSLGGSPWVLVIGLLFALYGVRGVAEAFRQAVQNIWKVPESKRLGFPASLPKNIGLVMVGGSGFILASISAGLVAGAGRGLVFNLLGIALNLFILFWLFVFLLNFSLPRHITVREARVGAAVAALGLMVLQGLGGYVLAHELQNLNALYSYFAISLGLLFWIYLQAQIVMYAAEVAIVSSQKLWPRSLQNDQKITSSSADSYATRHDETSCAD